MQNLICNMSIPHICPFLYTNAFWGLWKLYTKKVRKFATKTASRQNSVNQYFWLVYLVFWLVYLVFWLAYLLFWLAYLVFWLAYLVFCLVYLVLWLVYLVFWLAYFLLGWCIWCFGLHIYYFDWDGTLGVFVAILGVFFIGMAYLMSFVYWMVYLLHEMEHLMLISRSLWKKVHRLEKVHPRRGWRSWQIWAVGRNLLDL